MLMTKREDKPRLAINDLERYAPAGVVAAMDAAALGAFVRLLGHAWNEEPPCSLPADESTLELVARTREWSQVRPALLAVWKPDPSGRLINSQARAIYDALAAEVAAFSEKQRRASQARWSKPSGPIMPRDPGGMPVASRRDSGGMPAGSSVRSAPSLRSESFNAPLPQRPSPEAESERPSERTAGREEVIGMVGEGARAIEARLLLDWRITHSQAIAEKALERWRKAGICKAPVSKATEIAMAPKMKPAIVETAVLKTDDKHKLELDAGHKDFNAYAYFVSLLGLTEKSARRGPIEPYLHIANHWSKRREEVMPAIRMQAAIDLRKLNPTTSTAARVGGG